MIYFDRVIATSTVVQLKYSVKYCIIIIHFLILSLKVKI